MTTLTLNLDTIVQLTDAAFYALCQANPAVRCERTAKGELVVMPPTGGDTGSRNFEIYIDLGNWNRQTKLGKAFDSSTMFQLPNGAYRSPDVAWIQQERWEALSPKERETFPPICPDFMVELRSASDSLKTIQDKMQEYMENGARLGWLIDPQNKQVEIYRLGQEKEILQAPTSLSGEDVLLGFLLSLERIL